jgi:hypothetical protein
MSALKEVSFMFFFFFSSSSFVSLNSTSHLVGFVDLSTVFNPKTNRY